MSSAKETTFTLSEKIEFANREIGDTDQGFEITMRAPTYRDIQQTTALSQHVYRAIASAMDARAGNAQAAAQQAANDAANEVTGAEMLMMLSMHGDMRAILQDFEALALRVCSWNDKTPVLKRHLEDMSIDDFRKMLGEYLGFFIVPSVLSEMERAT